MADKEKIIEGKIPARKSDPKPIYSMYLKRMPNGSVEFGQFLDTDEKVSLSERIAADFEMKCTVREVFDHMNCAQVATNIIAQQQQMILNAAQQRAAAGQGDKPPVSIVKPH